MLNITERQTGDVAILDLEGHLIMGGGSTALRDSIRRLVEGGKRNLLLNFAAVKYMDSTGVGELVSSLVSLNREGGHLKLFGLTERIREVMSLSSLLSLFEVFDEEAPALESFN